jgi:hypothetical protein
LATHRQGGFLSFSRQGNQRQFPHSQGA